VPENKGPEFLLVKPDAVRSALFELTHPESHIVVRDAADREMTAVVLGVDNQTGIFFWRPRDLAGLRQNERGNHELFAGAVFHFIATGYGGVRIHFRVPRPEAVTFEDGSAAYFSPLPDRLSRIQRRAMFRASLAGIPVPCVAKWKSGTSDILFSLRDISIEGVGMRTDKHPSELPLRGDVMKGVMLQFGDLGNLKVDLDVRNAYEVGASEAANAPTEALSAEPTPALPAANKVYESHLGAMITGLSPRDEVWLQQMVWRLEKLRTSRTDH